MLTLGFASIIISTQSLSPAHAATSAIDNISLTIPSACSLASTTDTFSTTISGSASKQIGDTNTLTITCNDPAGYSLYAIGMSSTDEPGTTALTGTKQGNSIKTGTATSGDTSNWNFKLANPSTGLTIASGFDAAHAIPTSSTLIASRSTGASAATGDTIEVSYSIYISPTQPADTYSGKVKYTLVQPANSAATKLMQDFSCSDLAADQTTTLLDIRDGNTYTVAKLKDGKCWMVENLRLGGAGLENRTLTSENSDVSSDFTLPESTTSGFTSGDYDTAWVYVDGTYGGYYSWKAATAGTGTGEMASGNATSSICPKGWRLPTSSEYTALATAYGGDNSTGSAALRAAPANFVYAGYYYSGSPYLQSSVGHYWSSTAYDSDSAYNLYLGSSRAYGPYSNNKYYGFSVKCVAR